jgi:cytochrome c-type biogenesis protein CcmF
VWNAFPGDFKPWEIPGDGTGMNPLLMDFWMVIHPPVLFIGYASSAIPFAYAIGSLVRRNYDKWIKESYSWVLFSMVTLGAGIFMGGYWAYKVLGWGGYWGWDPVENSSLIPWLVSVALMHSMMLQSRKGFLKKSNIVMALSYFILVFYSTFLTRSGVLSDFSVHSFAKSNILFFLLAAIMIFAAVSVYFFITRIKDIKSEKITSDIFTFEGMITFGIILLLIYAFVILAGTSLPIISSLFNKPANVTEKFYNSITVPFGVMILVFIILSMFTTGKYRKKDIIIAGTFSVIAGILFNVFFTKNIAAIIFCILSFFLSYMIFIDLNKHRKIAFFSSRITHLGIAILVLGIISSNFHSWTEQKEVTAGETIRSGKVSITLKGFHEAERSHIIISVSENGAVKEGKLDYYIDPKTESLYREPFIIPGITGDIYITPQMYNFASLNYSSALIRKDEEKIISGMKVKFFGFMTDNMGSEKMTIRANLLINGEKLFPGIRFSKDADPENIDQKISGTDKTVSVENFDATHHAVRLYINPGKNDVIPPDFAILEISYKRFIWVVWLGTVLVAAGFIVAMVKQRKEA